jgi:hypothetical protein
VIDRLLAAGSDLLISRPLFFRFCCTQYNIHSGGFLLLLLLNFIMGRRARSDAPDRVTVCVAAGGWRPSAPADDTAATRMRP